jgi:glycosyltransferase involved in cell wall biosynthesis
MVGPLVSIVIPYFDKGDLLERALESVIAQSWKDFELVIVDDGSTDFPDAKVSHLASALNPEQFRLIRHDSNLGAAAARNTGVKAVKGELIAFLDADDCWRPEKLNQQMSVARHFGSRFAACCTGFYVHRGNNVSAVDYTSKPRKKIAEEVLWGCSISPGSTMLVNRNVFGTVGLFDQDFRRLEDWDWLLRFSEHYEMYYVPTPLAHIFINEHRPSSSDLQQDQTLRAISRIGDLHLQRIRNRGWLAYNKFQSSLFVERAARTYRLGKPISAIVYVVRALIFYPGRNYSFFAMLMRSVRKLFASGRV